ncbi:MAG: AgmX/PglI C-terminal domain-containing protein [Deltaproteobacteria bacterium]|nr:AgmX/PglI C-terminal domain-containing protein [Deltaproteobacteria bacterium]
MRVRLVLIGAVGVGVAVAIIWVIARAVADHREAEHLAKLRATLSIYSPAVKKCYDDALLLRPGLSGRVLLHLDIVDGLVMSSVIAGDTTGDARMTACISTQARSWRFDPAVSDLIELPFTFTTADTP